MNCPFDNGQASNSCNYAFRFRPTISSRGGTIPKVSLAKNVTLIPNIEDKASKIMKGIWVKSQNLETKGTRRVADLTKEILMNIAKFLTWAG